MRTLLLFLAIVISTGLSAQSNFWSSANENSIVLNPENDRGSIPQAYHTFSLELDGLKNYLQDAPMAGTALARTQPLLLDLPLPNGEIHQFKIHESPVMKPGIAARYPHIRSYAGRATRDSRINVRLMYSDHGFFATFNVPNGRYTIQPYAKDIHDTYIVFDNKDEISEYQNFTCGVHDDDDFLQNPIPEDLIEEIRNGTAANARTTDDVVEILEYEIAIAGVAEWTSIHGGTVSGGMSAVNTVVNLLNATYSAETAIRFVLIDGNDQLIYTDPTTDPYTTVNLGASLLSQNQNNLDAVIGNDNYDIGHVMTIGCLDVGGIAGGRVCNENGKGAGVTCQGGSLQGAILNIALHEIAHQFSAGHTWNNCEGTIGAPPNEVDIVTQRAPGSAFEPGSGTTIMSYSGACGAQNVPNLSGDNNYYHVGSLQQIYTHSHDGQGSECPDIVAATNNLPELNLSYTNGFYIPISTPFELTASATDMDGDNLTFCWEQYNIGPLGDLGNPTGSAPSFRSYPPTDNPTRIFPRIQNVIQNSQSSVEVLPSYTRNMKFRCTVRDDNPEIGGVVWQEISFETTAGAGPFRVGYPNSNEILEVGQYIEVLWDVANTDAAPVNCQRVNILLSDNGGFDTPYVLAENVPNTGSHFVTIPDVLTQGARVKIQAADNIFFDLSNFNSEIVAPSTPGYSFSAGPFNQQVCAPDDIIIDLNTLSLLDYDSLISFSVSGLPAGANPVFSANPVTPSENATLTIETANITDEGFYAIEITATAVGGETLVRPVTFDIVLNDFSAVAPVGPANGSSGVSEAPTFNWTGTPNATSYDIEIADNPSFAAGSIIEAASNIVGTSYDIGVLLEKNTLYFWRVRPKNECGSGAFSTPQGFHTEVFECADFESLNVPAYISATGTPTVESTLVINSQGAINDLNITKLIGAHDQLQHIDVSLISPDNTEVVLFAGACGVATIFNMGLDDEAPLEIQCPPTSGAAYKPQGSLSDFDNLQATGTWTLRATVNNTAGFGGVIEEWGLQLCSNASANAPFLVTNEVMPVPPGQARQITNDFLLTQDDDNGPGQLTYTVVTAPEHGTLYFLNNPVEVGMIFRQSSINAGNVKYQHDGGPELTDGFNFAVEDGEGGWFGTPRFEIEIDPNVTVGTEDLNEAYQFSVFPNPAQDLLSLQFNQPVNDKVEVYITNVQGQVLQNQFFNNISALATINTSGLTNGIYFIYVKSEDTAVATEKFVIQR